MQCNAKCGCGERDFTTKITYCFLQSSVLADTGFDDINWYKRDASTSALLANAKMIGNDGHPLPTFADSLGKILEALGFWNKNDFTLVKIWTEFGFCFWASIKLYLVVYLDHKLHFTSLTSPFLRAPFGMGQFYWLRRPNSR